MTTLRLSTFTSVVVEPGGGRALVNRYTAHRVRLGAPLERALEELVAVDVDRPASDGATLLTQLCGYELASRGILVPAELRDLDAERRFLDSLEALVAAPPFFDVAPGSPAELEAPAIAFLGIPCDLGASYPGTSAGPALLRAASRRMLGDGAAPGTLVGADGAPAFAGTVVDLGDVDLRRRDLAAWMAAVTDVVAALPDGVVPIVVGGDHAMTFPVVEALYRRRGRRPFTIVHLDQHRDLQLRGELVDGRPVHLEPITHANVMSHVLALDPGMRLVQLGVAPYRAGCAAPERHAGVVGEPVTVLDIAALGVDAVAARVGDDQDVYLTIDVDVLAAPHVRATGYPAALGLDPITLFRLVDAIARRSRVIGVDLMEFGVALPQAGPAIHLEAELLANLLCHVVALLGQSTSSAAQRRG